MPNSKYPKTEVEEPKRPYRLWNASDNEVMRWRYYSDKRRAHQGALMEANWGKVGLCIHVFDARTARWLGEYKKTLHSIQFSRPQHIPEEN